MHVNEEDESSSIPQLNKESPRYCLNASIRKASRVITSLYSDAMDSSDLQGTQFTLLSTLSGMKETTIGALSDYLVMDQTTVTRSIHLLKKAGYVETVKGEDRRQRIIRLTAEGKKILKSSYPLWLDAQTELWEKLGNEKASLLLELSNKIIELHQES